MYAFENEYLPSGWPSDANIWKADVISGFCKSQVTNLLILWFTHHGSIEFWRRYALLLFCCWFDTTTTNLDHRLQRYQWQMKEGSPIWEQPIAVWSCSTYLWVLVSKTLFKTYFFGGFSKLPSFTLNFHQCRIIKITLLLGGHRVWVHY